jgi:hypothetical protein
VPRCKLLDFFFFFFFFSCLFVSFVEVESCFRARVIVAVCCLNHYHTIDLVFRLTKKKKEKGKADVEKFYIGEVIGQLGL